MGPSHGLRHAATLLITQSLSSIPLTAPPSSVEAALTRLVHDLVALVADVRGSPDALPWLISELNQAFDRLPHEFDRHHIKAEAANILGEADVANVALPPRDLFLVYVPADRLPVAAPLAVELTKRRLTIAFAEYEVASADELAAAISRGLRCHRRGVLLKTREFDRQRWPFVPPDAERFRVLGDAPVASQVLDLVAWARRPLA